MKILLINDTELEYGGAEKYLFFLQELLNKNGHQTKIFSSLFFNKKISYVTRIFNIIDYVKLKKIIESFKPDIVHIHKMNLALSPSILILIKRYDLPIVMTVHDFYYLCPDGWMINEMKRACNHGFSIKCLSSNCYRSQNGIIYKFFRIYSFIALCIHRRLLKKYIDTFISPSYCLTQMMKMNLGLNNITTIPNVISIDNRKIIEISNSKKIFFFGRLSKEKGIQTFIDSMPIILQTIPDTEFFIIGSGPDRKQYEQKVQLLNIQKKVHFLGFIFSKEIYNYLSQAELIIIPSLCAENNPLICLESMSCGRPIIASNLFGLSELIDNKIGRLFNPGDSSDLAQKIISLLKNFPQLQKMSQRCIEEFQERNNPDEHYQRIMEIYSQDSRRINT